NGFSQFDLDGGESGGEYTPSAVSFTAPAATVGTLAGTTASGVAGALTNGFNQYVSQYLANLATGLDLPSGSLPLVGANLATVLKGVVGTLNVSAATSMADLSSRLTAAGFQIDGLTTDAQLASLPPNQPADLVRVSRTYTLLDLAQATGLSASALASLPGLGQFGFNGSLNVSANAGYHIGFGVDTG